MKENKHLPCAARFKAPLPPHQMHPSRAPERRLHGMFMLTLLILIGGSNRLRKILTFLAAISALKKNIILPLLLRKRLASH